MKFTSERLKKEYRTIYELLYETPRIPKMDIGEELGICAKTAGVRLKEALSLKYIVGPHPKRKSFKNFLEYMTFVNCEDPLEFYLKYVKDLDVVYHAVMDGFADLWVISKEKLDLKNVTAEGYRSDYYISFAPNWSWVESIRKMREMILRFDLDDYTPKGIIKTRWNEPIEWTETDEILFREMKYNLRGYLDPTARKHKIFSKTAFEWLDKVPEYCTIATFYYPESLAAYDPYLFMFETDYEDFVIDVFSQLPTSSFFFKVSNNLFAHLVLDRQYLRNVDKDIDDFNQIHIPLIMRELLKKGIIRKKSRALISYHWRKNL